MVNWPTKTGYHAGGSDEPYLLTLLSTGVWSFVVGGIRLRRKLPLMIKLNALRFSAEEKI